MNERIIRFIEKADDDIEELRRAGGELKVALTKAFDPIFRVMDRIVAFLSGAIR